MVVQKLAVIEQGYVGLPLAMRAVQQWFDVVGSISMLDGLPRLSRGSRTSKT